MNPTWLKDQEMLPEKNILATMDYLTVLKYSLPVPRALDLDFKPHHVTCWPTECCRYHLTERSKCACPYRLAFLCRCHCRENAMSQLTCGYRRIKNTWSSHLASLQLEAESPGCAQPPSAVPQMAGNPAGIEELPADAQPEVACRGLRQEWMARAQPARTS